jgi:D-alanine-D-alanine ligase-like ATP-grasp enzyme
MKHVVDMTADRKAERAAPLGHAVSDPASQAFEGIDAPKYAKGGPLHVASENLKPNIYYKAQDSTLGADRVQGRCGVSRADIRLSEATDDESELVGLNSEPAMTKTPLAPATALDAGFSFGEPVAWMAGDASCDR